MKSAWFLPVVWSTFFFLLPFGVAWIQEVYWYLPLLLGVMFFSVRYHVAHQRAFYPYDHFFALLLITCNFYLYFQGGFNEVYAYLIPPFIVGSLSLHWCRKRRGYQWLHASWHAASAVLTSLCVLTYTV